MKDKTNDMSDRPPKAIATVSDLNQAYPDLCHQMAEAVRDKLLAELDDLTPEQARKRFPKLAVALSEPTAPGLDPDKGFILRPGDPFAEGVARTYAKEAVCQVPALPCLLPYKHQATKVALQSYIVRASGAGDTHRATIATEALNKCK